MATDPTTYIGYVIDIAKEVYDRIANIGENDDRRKRIVKNVELLKIIVKELCTLKETPCGKKAFDNFEGALKKCKAICNTHDDKGKLVQFFQVGTHMNELMILESELKKAVNIVLVVLGVMTNTEIAKTREEVQHGRQEALQMKREMHQDYQTLNQNVLDPTRGIYLPRENYTTERPTAVEKVEITQDAELLQIRWKDDKNKNIDRYELQINIETVRTSDSRLIPLPPEHCRHSRHSEDYSVKLGPPIFVGPGHYTVQVCGVSGAGPGVMSDSVSFDLQTAPPNKPEYPSTSKLSQTKVAVTTTRPSEENQNNSPVIECIVEYAKYEYKREPTWKCFTTKFEREMKEVTTTISCLCPDTLYYFRVKMKNRAGESIPSNETSVVTPQYIPGPPQNVRVSSKRTEKTLKIRWDKPNLHSDCVDKYKIQIWRAKKTEEKDSYTSGKHSYKFVDLKTNTKYGFRVQSINNRKEAGDWSDEIEGETRLSKAARIAATVGATAGGVVGAPVWGAAGGAVIAGKEKKSNSKKAVAGTAGAVGGAIAATLTAPLMGGIVGCAAHSVLARDLRLESPQTSDDEDDKKKKAKRR